MAFLKEKNVPEIIPIKYFIHQENLYFCEPFVPLNLDAALKDKKDDDEKLEIMINLAKSIAKMHNSDLVHGSITPSNIFVEK